MSIYKGERSIVIDKTPLGLRNDIPIALFTDCDGTAIDNGVIYEEILQGVNHIKAKGGLVALFTGRPFTKIGEHEKILNTHGVYSTGHGQRLTIGIVDIHHSLSKDEITTLISTVDSGKKDISYIACFPKNRTVKPLRWISDKSRVDELFTQFGSSSEITIDPLTRVEKYINNENVGFIIINTRSPHTVLNFPTEMNAILTDAEDFYHVIPQGISKLSAAYELASLLNIPTQVIINAGDRKSDRHLELPGSRRVLVGRNEEAIKQFSSLPNLIQIPTVREFGNHLRRQ